MLALLLVFLPFLQAASCAITIWGFANTPGVVDTTVNYGAFGDDGSPDGMMWMNSLGSIAVGAAGFVFTHFMKSQTGQNSELWTAAIGWLTNMSNPFALFRLAFCVICILEKQWCSTAEDKEAITYMKAWLTEKMSQFSVQPVAVLPTPPKATPKPPPIPVISV